ncbi:hypothetical protein TNCV_2339411 [Trichonephila clavipes]|nr:hypothetical protein TNCV_2339411 [Trichonephila clavipes]
MTRSIAKSPRVVEQCGTLIFTHSFSQKVEISRAGLCDCGAYICLKANDLLLSRDPGPQEVLRHPWSFRTKEDASEQATHANYHITPMR